MTYGGAPPGWYDDASGTGGRRWWDGHRWTEHRSPPPVQPAWQPAWQPVPPRRRPARRLLIWVLPLVVLVLVGVGLLVGVVSGGGTKTQWYDEGYAVGRDKAAGLARLGGSAQSACDLALMDKIEFDDNARSTRVKDLRRGCVQGVSDALDENPGVLRGRP